MSRKRISRRRRNRKGKTSQNEVRLVIKNKAWEQLSKALGEIITSGSGAPGKLCVRLFLEALLHLVRTGAPWRDLPSFFGKWEAVYKRFRRWEACGIWLKLWRLLQQERFRKARRLFIDSTVVRAHRHAAGAPKKAGGQDAQGLGRSRGGFSSKIHAGCVDEKTPVAFVLTGGETHDAPVFDILVEEVPPENSIEDAVMDKGYDSNHIREEVRRKGMTPVIPPRSNRKEQILYDKGKYALRNKVECFFSKVKEFRGIATRYQKLARTFMALLHLVSAFILIR